MRINKYGEGNQCPICGSTNITRIESLCVYRYINMRTGAEFLPEFESEKLQIRRYVVSNRQKAKEHDLAEITTCMFQCRKCGWTSQLFGADIPVMEGREDKTKYLEL